VKKATRIRPTPIIQPAKTISASFYKRHSVKSVSTGMFYLPGPRGEQYLWAVCSAFIHSMVSTDCTTMDVRWQQFKTLSHQSSCS